MCGKVSSQDSESDHESSLKQIDTYNAGAATVLCQSNRVMIKFRDVKEKTGEQGYLNIQRDKIEGFKATVEK